ncbi:hypothetical protein BDN72DRAFT_339149 [Pluteus cervinus]|uniref:Uncharacterized protein n=1 Tax=Pluteus cervinus TaxID=181527 RepID=A0ACD3AB23_9AGAR|nr:hypothetical protein BDN72DRAFT_339149 [Pluteus cervinus]
MILNASAPAACFDRESRLLWAVHQELILNFNSELTILLFIWTLIDSVLLVFLSSDSPISSSPQLLLDVVGSNPTPCISL